MTDIWVCSTCHSINRLRNTRCYKCGAPQSAATGEGATLRLERAIAARVGVRYRSAWLRGLLASFFILVVTALGVVLIVLSFDVAAWLRDQVDLIVAGRPTDAAGLLLRTQPAVQVGLIRLGALSLAVLFFAAWLSRVIMNIPALGGGVPNTTPTKAFVYPLIPIVNLVKVPGMIQEALYRVDPRAGGFFMVALAWFGLVGSWILGFLAGWVLDIKLAGDLQQAASRDAMSEALRTYFDLSFGVEVVQGVMVTLGSLVLIGVMIRIERRSRARDREIREAAVARLSDADSVDTSVDTPPAAAGSNGPSQAPPAVLPPPPVPATDVGRGPHLTLTVSDDDQLVAELDGESEALSVDGLRAAAVALADAGGSATIHVRGSGDGPRSTAREAFGILGDAGVPTSFAS